MQYITLNLAHLLVISRIRRAPDGFKWMNKKWRTSQKRDIHMPERVTRTPQEIYQMRVHDQRTSDLEEGTKFPAPWSLRHLGHPPLACAYNSELLDPPNGNLAASVGNESQSLMNAAQRIVPCAKMLSQAVRSASCGRNRFSTNLPSRPA